MEFGDKLRALRKQRGITQEQLAEILGVERSSVGKYEGKSKVIPSDDIKTRIAEYFGVSMDYLLGITDQPYPVMRDVDRSSKKGILIDLSPLPEMRSIPLLGDIACGTPITAEENLDGYVNVPVDVVCHFALRCKGDSMASRVQDGDLVYIRQQEDVTDGQIAAVLIDNEATLKHVYHIPDGVQLVAENPAYPPMIYTGDACTEVRILGLAVAYQRMLV